MDWLYYLLEANLYLLLFYGFYLIALAKTTFYSSNRYYLVISSLTAFLLPIVQLGFLNPKPIIDDILFPPPIVYAGDQLANMNFAPIQETFSVADLLYPIYLIIALGFAIKMGFGLYKITILWLKAKKLQSGTITIVELDGEKSAFSFFNLLFIHPHLAEKQTILTHEMVHIKQRHSLDIVFFEILQIICWFNPIIYFIQTDIKLLHEYIADELSVDSDQKKHEYAMFLIENSFGIIPQRLTNQIFNQSILKRRINMLNKKRTAGWARLRLLLALPLVGGMLCASTMAFTKDYGYLDLLPENAILQEPATKVSSEEKMAKEGRYAPSYIFDQQNQYKSLEKRLIIVNGIVIKDNNKYYGNRNADKIVFLNAQNAQDKYGDSAKYGAVEVSGSKTVLVYQPPYVIADTAKFPPPIVKPDRKSNNQEPRVQNIKKTNKDQVKFPPPIVKPDPVNQHNFSPRSELKHDGKQYQIVKPDPRYIIINGSPVADMYQFYGVRNSESVNVLTPTQATKAYGSEKGRYGAVEIKGSSITFVPALVGAPPPPMVRLEINRNKGDLLIIPNTENELKTLTVYNRKGKVIYNSANYEDNWDGKMGNYKEFSNKTIAPDSYTFLVKIDGKSRENKRGQITIK